jgi:hypothetical protein
MHFTVRRRLKRSLAHAGGLAGLLVMANAGIAQASCPAAPISQPFAAYGDMAPYELAPQGAFDGDIDGWDLAGADLDDGALRVNAKGAAASSAVCVDAKRPTWRLFVRRLGRGKAQLRFDMLFVDESGRTRVVQAGRISSGKGDYDDWQPTPVLELGRGLPLSKSPTGTLSVRLRFTAEKGAWAIDDVYIDPYRS